MRTVDFIAKYGEAEYDRTLRYRRAYHKANREKEAARQKEYNKQHREEKAANAKRYLKENPDKVKANAQESDRKGGRRYDRTLLYNRTGLRSDRKRIRAKHGKQYRPYKAIIAPDSQIHHEWIPNTSEYTGVALVEKEAHQYGIIDVIEILDGKITLLSEEQIRNGGV